MALMTDVPALISTVKDAINAICRSRELNSQEKLDALEQIQRHADKKDAAVRTKIRWARGAKP